MRLVVSTLIVALLSAQSNGKEETEARPTEKCDLLVVGAGISGAFTAARYRQFNPHDSICIVERSVSSGGRLQSLPLDDENGYQAEFGGMRYFIGIHTLVPALLKQLNLDSTAVPYVNAQGTAYLRGKHIPLSNLAAELASVYNIYDDEKGLAPDALYNAIITQVLKQRNLTYDTILSDPYMVNHTMFNLLRDAGMSSEAIASYTDTAGYEWVLGSNAAIVAQEDQAIEGWGRTQQFVKTGFQSAVTTLMKMLMSTSAASLPPPETGRHSRKPAGTTKVTYLKALQSLSWDEDKVTAVVGEVMPGPVGDPFPEPVDDGTSGNSGGGTMHAKPSATTTYIAKKVVLTVNPLQLFRVANWPWAVNQLIFDVEQVETVKIFIRFSDEWWTDVLPGKGRSITTLPLRQVWAYAPNTLMVYGDSNNARFWKPYLAPHAKPVPEWFEATDLPDLSQALFAQLSEMFQVKEEVISAAATKISFAYWERCTAFWRAGCDITGNIAKSSQPIPGVPLYFASDIWSAQQGWVEGALDRSEAVLAKFGIPSIAVTPLAEG